MSKDTARPSSRSLPPGIPTPGPDAAVYVISVAAELAGMHAQTLRNYDRLGLVTPSAIPEPATTAALLGLTALLLATHRRRKTRSRSS